jgi:hypothetical protein
MERIEAAGLYIRGTRIDALRRVDPRADHYAPAARATLQHRLPGLIRADLPRRREQADGWRTHLARRPAAAKLVYYLSPNSVTDGALAAWWQRAASAAVV